MNTRKASSLPEIDDVLSYNTRKLEKGTVAELETQPHHMNHVFETFGANLLAKNYPQYYNQCLNGRSPTFFQRVTGKRTNCEEMNKYMESFRNQFVG